jgi:hypothetical protein
MHPRTRALLLILAIMTIASPLAQAEELTGPRMEIEFGNDAYDLFQDWMRKAIAEKRVFHRDQAINDPLVKWAEMYLVNAESTKQDGESLYIIAPHQLLLDAPQHIHESFKLLMNSFHTDIMQPKEEAFESDKRIKLDKLSAAIEAEYSKIAALHENIEEAKRCSSTQQLPIALALTEQQLLDVELDYAESQAKLDAIKGYMLQEREALDIRIASKQHLYDLRIKMAESELSEVMGTLKRAKVAVEAGVTGIGEADTAERALEQTRLRLELLKAEREEEKLNTSSATMDQLKQKLMETEIEYAALAAMRTLHQKRLESLRNCLARAEALDEERRAIEESIRQLEGERTEVGNARLTSHQYIPRPKVVREWRH